MRKLAAVTEFSPGIVQLDRVLEMAAECLPDRDKFLESLRIEYFSNSAPTYEGERRLQEQLKRANNVLIGMKEYQLVDRSNQLTPLASDLLSKESTAARLELLASQILKNLGGVDVLRSVQSLQARGVRVTKDSLAAELQAVYDYEMPRDTTKHTGMLAWLRQVGILPPTGYTIDEDRAAELAGVPLRPLDQWQSMPLPLQAFLQSLRRLALSTEAGDYAVKDVLDQAEVEYGHIYSGARTASTVLAPLESQGWIVLSGATGGRGAKSGRVAPSAMLLDFDIELALGFSIPSIPADLRSLINRPMADITANLTSKSTYDAGIALELLTLRMCLALGLSPIEFRKRDDKTGDGEVDLLAEGVHLHFSRWLFQCKNQRAAVTVSTLAKEIGMAVLLQAQVIVLATTGRFAASVSIHADQVAQMTAMQVVLVDGQAIRRFAGGGDDTIKRHFRSGAANTLRLKSPQRRSGSIE